MYEDGITKHEGAIKVVERIFTTETDVATFAGVGRVEGSGMLADFMIKFGSPAPSAISYSITDDDGAVVAAGSCTATTARVQLEQVIPIYDGLNIALSGNATANATGSIKFYFVG